MGHGDRRWLAYAGGTDTGRGRSVNQDSAYASPRLLAVADGMGGHAHGEIACSVVVAALHELDASLSDPRPGRDLLRMLADGVTDAFARLNALGEARPEAAGMGSTLTALAWDGSRLGVAHIGDSRAYRYSGGVLRQITRDHTLVQSLIDAGRLTQAEAEDHPRRSIVVRALQSGGPEPEPDLFLLDITVGDRLLVCSDGLTAVVSDHAIADVLSGVPEPREAVARLIDLANRGGGPDNITCLVADVVSAPVGAPGGAGRGVSAGRGGGSGAGVGGAGRGAAAGVGTGMTGEERAVVGSAVGAAGGVTSPDTGATGGVVGSAGVGGLTRAGVAAQHSDPDRAAVTVPGSTAGGVGGGTGPMAAGVGTGSGLGAACGPPAGWASTTGVAPAWGDVWVSGDARVLGDVRVVEATRPDRPPGMALRCGDVGPATAPSLVFGAAASRPEAAGRLPAPSAGDRRRSGAVGAGSGIGAGPGIRAGTAVTSVPGSEPRVGGPGIGQATRPGPEAGAGSGAGTDPEARNGPVTETGPVTEAGSGSVTGSGSSTDPRTGFGPVLGDGPGRSTAVRVGSRPPQPPDPGATESHTEHSAACENTEVPRRRSLRLPRWFRRLLGD